MQVVQHAAGAGALDVSGHTAAAERVHEPAVPVKWREESRRGRACRIAQIGNLVDGAIDGARFYTHDVRHGMAVHAGRREISRPGTGRVERLEGALATALDRRRRLVLVFDLRRRTAVFVLRRAELPALGLAHKRLLMGAREHRAGDWVVHQFEGRARLRAVHFQRTPAERNSFQHADNSDLPRPHAGGALSHAGDVGECHRLAVDLPCQLALGRGAGCAHERIAAGDHVCTARHDRDGQPPLVGPLLRGRPRDRGDRNHARGCCRDDNSEEARRHVPSCRPDSTRAPVSPERRQGN